MAGIGKTANLRGKNGVSNQTFQQIRKAGNP